MGRRVVFSNVLVSSMWHPAPPNRNRLYFALQAALEFLFQYPLVRKTPLIITQRYETCFEKNQDLDQRIVLYDAYHPRDFIYPIYG